MPKSRVEVVEFTDKNKALSMARSLAFTPDGALITWSRRHSGIGPTFITRWDLEKRRAVRSVAGKKEYHDRPELRAAPDGSVFALETHSGESTVIQVRDAKTLATKRTFDTGAYAGARSIDWSPDGKLLAVSSGDGRGRIWDLHKPSQPKVVERGGYGIVAFDAAGNLFGADNDVFSINVKTGALKRKGTLMKTALDPYHVLSPDRTLLVTSRVRAIDKVCVADTATWKTRMVPVKQKKWLTTMAVSPDNRFLAMGELDGVVTVWDLGSGKKALSFTTSKKCLSGLAFSPDGKLLAGCNHYKIFFLELSSTNN